MDAQYFKEMIIRNMEFIKNDMDEIIFHDQKTEKWLNERKLQIQECKVQKAKAFIASLIYTKSNRTVSGKGNESSSSAARQGMVTNQRIKAINLGIKVVGQVRPGRSKGLVFLTSKQFCKQAIFKICPESKDKR
ncbi:hypothetical protein Tco_0001815 [Tanacetum coccineum]